MARVRGAVPASERRLRPLNVPHTVAVRTGERPQRHLGRDGGDVASDWHPVDQASPAGAALGSADLRHQFHHL